jgi:hypothetical protein
MGENDPLDYGGAAGVDDDSRVRGIWLDETLGVWSGAGIVQYREFDDSTFLCCHRGLAIGQNGSRTKKFNKVLERCERDIRRIRHRDGVNEMASKVRVDKFWLPRSRQHDSIAGFNPFFPKEIGG